MGASMVEDEADYRGERKHRLHYKSGPQVDGGHEEAHGRGREEGAGELQPLGARESALRALHARLGKDVPSEAYVPPPRQHDDGARRKVQLFEPVSKTLESTDVRDDGPNSIIK
ncbi:MAG: hypothetical protein LC751_11225 [Actinobacteria bacterium]|nr:hypothetical protein [Actinomycetota bacterium]MCA1737951.1 hypothetical protein [Actinomycetota bacterium]